MNNKKNELEKAYEAKSNEDKIYEKWEKTGSFKAHVNPNKKAYTISMPPPNATGVLHLGHAVMLAIEDILIRQKRMDGHEALWLPGTDHASIATENKVEEILATEGLNKRKLGREKFLTRVKQYVGESQSTIKKQIRKMGSSCDWSREKYTFEDSMNVAVNRQFSNMFEDGLIYKGGRIVNWDPQMQTTVADDEMEYKEETTNFYYFRFGPVVIGTARPETKFLDKIIVVHPEDKRYKRLIGKEFEAEWIEGKIKVKVIGDECADPKLGTGAMSITPAHSLVDFELAQKHGFETPQIIDFEGRICKEASVEFGGMPIKQAREKIVEKLKKKGLLVKIDENYAHNISLNYRGKGIIEPQIMRQWFVDVNKKVIKWKGKKRSIKEVLHDTVESKMIKIVPSRFEKTYFHWINNLRDWCISRQIWWGHQIPIWYKVDKATYDQFQKIPIATSLHLEQLGVKDNPICSPIKPKGEYFIQDPDTLDTWFSSALWTFATLGWPEKTPDLEYFHPTDVLETGYDILFFWVARMILSSTYLLRRDGLPEEKSIPFKTVYLHGLVRDKQGRKMSKSLNNGIDPIEMINKYGTDSVRLSLIIGSTPGNDTRLYEEKIAGYRNFVNKIWNSARFALMNVDNVEINKEFKSDMIRSMADKWILNELQKLIQAVNSDFKKLRLSDAGTKIYEFIWKQYCDWYLEISKGEHKNPAVLLHVLKTYLKLIHPFTPFVSEKIWQYLSPKTMLINEEWPKVNKKLIFPDESNAMNLIHEIISSIRKARAELKVEPIRKIQVTIYSKKHAEILEQKREPIMRLARLESLAISNSGQKPEQSKAIIVEGNTIYIHLEGLIDPEKERNKLLREISTKETFVKSLQSKLSNENFTKNAPAEIVEKEGARLKNALEELEKLQKELEMC